MLREISIDSAVYGMSLYCGNGMYVDICPAYQVLVSQWPYVGSTAQESQTRYKREQIYLHPLTNQGTEGKWKEPKRKEPSKMNDLNQLWRRVPFFPPLCPRCYQWPRIT
ncbi:hypothetical protein BDFG_07416 [Blastomyces dermatitidis ATCC 26199]|nr:hypothetical protein BDFG_07416 [Blastomyces dermatitidis ATCC 26199]